MENQELQELDAEPKSYFKFDGVVPENLKNLKNALKNNKLIATNGDRYYLYYIDPKFGIPTTYLGYKTSAMEANLSDLAEYAVLHKSLASLNDSHIVIESQSEQNFSRSLSSKKTDSPDSFSVSMAKQERPNPSVTEEYQEPKYTIGTYHNFDSEMVPDQLEDLKNSLLNGDLIATNGSSYYLYYIDPKFNMPTTYLGYGTSVKEANLNDLAEHAVLHKSLASLNDKLAESRAQQEEDCSPSFS